MPQDTHAMHDTTTFYSARASSKTATPQDDRRESPMRSLLDIFLCSYLDDRMHPGMDTALKIVGARTEFF
jgi:hypothetical protein